MANYIAWYGKKRANLLRREQAFGALLQSGALPSEIVKAAEEVRAAQVRALKSKRAEFAPSERNAAAVKHFDHEIAFWLGLSAGEIIDGYRTGQLKGHRSGARNLDGRDSAS